MALSLLAGLRSLTMRLHSSFQPAGALRGALPALTHLAVYCDRDIRSPDSCACFGLLADLIGGAAGSLRQVSVKNFLPLPADVLAELRRCRGLRELACGTHDLAVVANLPRLAKLQLHMDDYYESLRASDAKSGSGLAALTHCDALNSLHHLSVSSSLDDVGCYIEKRVLRAVLPVAVLERMRRLRSVSLNTCQPEVLAVLAALPDLEELTACVWCQVRCRCEDAFADFKRRRPDVKVDLQNGHKLYENARASWW